MKSAAKSKAILMIRGFGSTLPRPAPLFPTVQAPLVPTDGPSEQEFAFNLTGLVGKFGQQSMRIAPDALKTTL